ncbi:hypothetical protein ACS0TY_006721 [Phlomoides rotata]
MMLPFANARKNLFLILSLRGPDKQFLLLHVLFPMHRLSGLKTTPEGRPAQSPSRLGNDYDFCQPSGTPAKATSKSAEPDSPTSLRNRHLKGPKSKERKRARSSTGDSKRTA